MPWIGPTILFIGAGERGRVSACSSWPLATPLSRPPLFLVAVSIEYCLATCCQLLPDWSAALAALAWASVFVRTIRRFRVSWVPNCEVWAA